MSEKMAKWMRKGREKKEMEVLILLPTLGKKKGFPHSNFASSPSPFLVPSFFPFPSSFPSFSSLSLPISLPSSLFTLAFPSFSLLLQFPFEETRRGRNEKRGWLSSFPASEMHTEQPNYMDDQAYKIETWVTSVSVVIQKKVIERLI